MWTLTHVIEADGGFMTPLTAETGEWNQMFGSDREVRNHRCLQARAAAPTMTGAAACWVFCLFHTSGHYFPQRYFPIVYERSQYSIY